MWADAIYSVSRPILGAVRDDFHKVEAEHFYLDSAAFELNANAVSAHLQSA